VDSISPVAFEGRFLAVRCRRDGLLLVFRLVVLENLNLASRPFAEVIRLSFSRYFNFLVFRGDLRDLYLLGGFR